MRTGRQVDVRGRRGRGLRLYALGAVAVLVVGLLLFPDRRAAVAASAILPVV